MLDVRPTFASRPPAADAAVPPPAIRRPRAGLAERERQQFDVTGGRESPDAAQFAELVHAPGVLARDQLPLVLFLVARDPPPGVKAPDLFLLRPVPQLTQRHPELGGPAAVVVRHLAVPDRVPRRVPLVLAVAEDEVDLGPAGGQVELETGPLVVVAVETHADDVDGVVAEVVAPPRVPVDLRRVVERPDCDVDVAVVVQDLQFGRLAGRGAFGGEVLGVLARPFALGPGLVVEASVDHRRLPLDAHGVVDARGYLRPDGFAASGWMFAGGA